MTKVTEERKSFLFFDFPMKYGKKGLRGAEFRNCRLDYSVFKGMDLTGAKFLNCDLEKVNFNDCILKNASFSGSILNETNFTGAEMQGAKLSRVKDFWRVYGNGREIVHFDDDTNSEIYRELLWTMTMMKHGIQIGCTVMTRKQWESISDQKLLQISVNAPEIRRRHGHLVFDFYDKHFGSGK